MKLLSSPIKILFLAFFTMTASINLPGQKSSIGFFGSNCVGANGGIITPDTISICDGDITTITSIGAASASGITNQWLVSNTTGGPYNSVVGGIGAQTDSYTSDPLTAGIYYFVLENTCSFGPSTALSNEVTVIVNSYPSIFANATATAVCFGTPVTLTGSGGTSYAWSNSVIDGVSFTPTATNTYIVVGTDSTGCQTMDMITIVVNQYPVVTLNFPVDTICLNGGVITLSGGSPVGGTWLGTGVTGNSFDPMASGNGFNLITYTYADGIGCSSSDTASLFVEICNAVPENVTRNSFTIFPNPSNGQFNILINNSDETSLLEISNTMGQLIFSEKIPAFNGLQQKDLNLENKSTGIYFVHLSNSIGTVSKKVSIY